MTDHGEPVPITANTVLPARHIPLHLQTSDGLMLVGEASLPVDRAPRATIVCVHPLPTHGGMMDSHIFRKAAWRLPALAGIAVVRFNTSGTASAAGRSEGVFDQGNAEGLDLQAAVDWVRAHELADPWLVGWSFGADVVMAHRRVPDVQGAILLSPPLRFIAPGQLQKWSADGRPVVALVPELDDFLPPPAARQRFAPVAQAQVIEGAGAKHLWIGESWVRWVLDHIVAVVAPAVSVPLPAQWTGPHERWNDLPPAHN